MARDTPVQHADGTDDETTLPHLVTILGQGLPASFEVTVDGEIEMVGGDPADEATIVSGTAAEGSIDVGVQRFRFSGSMANVTFVNEDGELPPKPLTPEVHVDYNVRE